MIDRDKDIRMDDSENKLQQDAFDYRKRLYDFIPINAKLIEHVRRLDGFNVSSICQCIFSLWKHDKILGHRSNFVAKDPRLWFIFSVDKCISKVLKTNRFSFLGWWAARAQDTIDGHREKSGK